tara:strand:+ start:217 stop:603 length:387 start_codon:yes stop_codon:yes gene_type:complete
MISFLILNIISMIIINFFKINSLKKIVFFFLINFVYIIFISSNLYSLIEHLIFLICVLYIFVNFYTIRYSSIRLEILKDLSLGKKIISEEDLYNNRKKRLEDVNTTFMKKNLFLIILFLVQNLKKILI